MLFGSFQSNASAILCSHLAHPSKDMFYSHSNLTDVVIDLQFFLREWIVTVALPHDEVFSITLLQNIMLHLFGVIRTIC